MGLFMEGTPTSLLTRNEESWELGAGGDSKRVAVSAAAVALGAVATAAAACSPAVAPPMAVIAGGLPPFDASSFPSAAVKAVVAFVPEILEAEFATVASHIEDSVVDAETASDALREAKDGSSAEVAVKMVGIALVSV